MICAKGRGRGYVEEQAHGGADDRGAEATGGGRKAEDVAREVGVSKHTIYAWKAKYGGMDVSQAQEAKQLRDENTKLRKLVADLSLDKEALQSVIRKNGPRRYVSRHLHEGALQRMQQRTTPEVMRLRAATVELPFAALKCRIFGHPRFLLRGLGGAQTEINLATLVYNLKRMLNILGGIKLRSALAS